jgi:hypothetical protein
VVSHIVPGANLLPRSKEQNEAHGEVLNALDGARDADAPSAAATSGHATRQAVAQAFSDQPCWSAGADHCARRSWVPSRRRLPRLIVVSASFLEIVTVAPLAALAYPKLTGGIDLLHAVGHE